MLTKITTILRTYPTTAANLAIRLGFSVVIGSLYPTFCFILYLAHNRIFSYALFSAGHFGLLIFFYTTAFLLAIFAFYAFLPVFTWNVASKNRKGLWWLAPSITSFTAVVVTGVLAWQAPQVFLAVCLFGGGYLITAIGAFKCKRTISYLSGCTIFAIIIFGLPIYFADKTADILGKGLSVFRVGGGIPVEVRSRDGRPPLIGKLLLLAPDVVCVLNNAGDCSFIERSPETIVVYPRIAAPAQLPAQPSAEPTIQSPSGTATDPASGNYVATIVSLVFGGLASFGATLVAERLKRPKLKFEMLSPADCDYSTGPQRLANKARFLQAKVVNQDLSLPLRWLNRNAAMYCRGQISVTKENGDAVFSSTMPLRWSGTPEPVPMKIKLGSSEGIIIDHFRMEQRVDIPAGETQTFDIAAQFDDESEFYGWCNESYFSSPLWRNPSRRLESGNYLVKVEIIHIGGKCSYYCKLIQVSGKIELEKKV